MFFVADLREDNRIHIKLKLVWTGGFWGVSWTLIRMGYVNEFQRADEGSVPQGQVLSACDGKRRLVLAVQMWNKCKKKWDTVAFASKTHWRLDSAYSEIKTKRKFTKLKNRIDNIRWVSGDKTADNALILNNWNSNNVLLIIFSSIQKTDIDNNDNGLRLHGQRNQMIYCFVFCQFFFCIFLLWKIRKTSEFVFNLSLDLTSWKLHKSDYYQIIGLHVNISTFNCAAWPIV